MSESVSFDRAARTYDRTRAMSSDARERVADILQQELLGRGQVLEVGVGTGRIALPLHQRGLPMAGVDLSAPMLERLIENAGGSRPFSLGRADATTLPFRDASFGAALACHIFHLIPNWPDAIAEMIRVVRPGGVVLCDVGSFSETPLREIVRRLCEVLGITRRFPGLDADSGDPPDAVKRVFAAYGFAERHLPEVVSKEDEASPTDYLRTFAERTWSWTWDLSDEQIEHAVREAGEWVRERFGDPDEPISIEIPIRWSAFEPAG